MIVGEKNHDPSVYSCSAAFDFRLGNGICKSEQIRANQVYHVQHVLDTAKTICLPEDQLDLLV